MTDSAPQQAAAREAIALSLVDAGLVTSEELALEVVDHVLADPAVDDARLASTGDGDPVTVEDLVADPEVLGAVCLRHGMHPNPSPSELFADVQHLLAPLVGQMLLDGQTGHTLERLTLALALAQRAQADDAANGGPAAEARRLREWRDRIVEQMGQAMTAERYMRLVHGTSGVTDLSDTIDDLLADRDELRRLRAEAGLRAAREAVDRA